MDEEELFGEESSNEEASDQEVEANEEELFGGSSPEEGRSDEEQAESDGGAQGSDDAGSDGSEDGVDASERGGHESEESGSAGSGVEETQGSEAEEDRSDAEEQGSDAEVQGSDVEAEVQGSDAGESDVQSGESGNEAVQQDSSAEEDAATPQPQQSDSDSDADNTNAAKTQVASSNESNSDQEEKVTNLFGDADDISSSDEEQVPAVEKRARISEDEEEPEQVKESMETRIEVEIPKIATDLGSSIHFVRFPNFISAEARPFDPAVYEDEIEEDELLDEEGRTRLKLKVENTMRWKKYVDENGIELQESNSRLVRWSDGSMSLHLGSEIFDVHQMSLQGDHNHLFIRQGTGLQGQAVFKTKLTFRPHSTKSATHKRMTSRLAMRHNQNQQKVRVLPIAGQDPESRKAVLLKEEEDQLKAHMRREAQKRRMREKSHMRGLSSGYLEDRYDEMTNEDDDESVSAIKNRFKSGHPTSHRDNIYSSDSDTEVGRRLMNAKDLSSDDDDDFIDGSKRRKQEEADHGKKKKYIVSDEEDGSPDDAGDSHAVSDE